MKNLLAFIGALVVGFAVAGWYLGWYQLGITKSSDGTLHVETNVNTQKVADDSTDAFKKAGAFVGDHLDKSTPPPTPGGTPGPQDQNQATKVTVFGIDLSPSEKK
jgi:hypothetical protein